jgi:FixJ family two-component response regulator
VSELSKSFTGLVAVVDDDHRVRESLQELLESADLRVLVCASAKELLNAEMLPEIGCVISDVGMPVMDGFSLQRLVKANRPGLPVILISGRHIGTASAGKFDNGVVVLEKPYDATSLLEAVKIALRERGSL